MRSSEKIDFEALEQKMKENEILCEKYNQSLDKKYQNSDHYVCAISLSENGKELIVYNFKPQGYKGVAQEIKEGANDVDNLGLIGDKS